MKKEMGSEENTVPSRRVSHQAHFGREIANEIDVSMFSPPAGCVIEKESILKGNNNSNHEIDVSMFLDVKYCYYLLEAMPLPGPTWSTTGPSVLAEPPLALSIEASSGLLECGENQASSSHSWWLGFLEGLDGNSTNENLELPFVENIVMEDFKGLSHASKFVDAIGLDCCPDDWLVIPTMEKDLGDMVVMP